jgi:hypothetical protein
MFRLELYDNIVYGKLTLNGGAGFDELYESNNWFDPMKASLKSFP